jgi:hypothetical protein
MLGRHAALDDASESTVVASVLRLFRVRKAAAPKELQKMAQTNHISRLIRRWVNAFRGRHLDQRQLCRSLLQEDARFITSRARLEAHIALMQVHISANVSELVFNLDEVGSCDWEDRQPRQVVRPVTVSVGEVFHAV